MPTVASGPSSALASSGALIAGHIANFTISLVQQLPSSVQTGIDSASQYIHSTTGIDPAIFYSSAAAAVLLLGAIPTAYAKSAAKSNKNGNTKKMSRHGWSYNQPRGPLSPFGSTLGDARGEVPPVTEEDYSYITTEDLRNHEMNDRYSRAPPASSSHNTRSNAGPSLVIDDDDILLIKNKGVTYPEHFPAYSIGDGKLLVGDVRERVQMIMKLSDRRTRKIKLLYKGRQLKDDDEPVCTYNVKNNSEILVVLPDENVDDDSSSDSDGEVVVVGREDGDRSKKSKNKKRKGKKKGRNNSSSPRDSNLDVPNGGAGSGSRAPSPAGANASGAAPSAAVEKLNAINTHFTTKLLPLCVQFTASPPSDPKKREDEHRRLSETIMQQVLLKLDEVETNGEEEARARRKELVTVVQDVLKGLDNKLRG